MRRAIGHLGRVLLGLVFLAAGLLKAIDPAEFVRQIDGYGMVGAGTAGFLAPILIAVEITLGVLLLTGVRPRASVPAGSPGESPQNAS